MYTTLLKLGFNLSTPAALIMISAHVGCSQVDNPSVPEKASQFAEQAGDLIKEGTPDGEEKSPWPALMLSENSNEESEYPKGILVDPQGRVVVYGYLEGTITKSAIWRYKNDGTLDTSFGTNGWIVWDSPDGTNNRLVTGKIKTDGSFIFGGWTTDGGIHKAIMAKFDSSGQAITTFSSDGFKILFNDSKSKWFWPNHADVHIDKVDRLIAVTAASGDRMDFGFHRYDANGNADTTFNGTGYLQVALATSEQWPHITGDADFYYATATSGAVVKIRQSDGAYLEAIEPATNCNQRAITLSDKYIYASGYVVNPDSTVDSCWRRISRSDFTLDLSYGTNGIFQMDVPGTGVDDRAWGGLAVNGSNDETYLGVGANGDALHAKLTAAGAFDTNFGSGGIVTYGDGLSPELGTAETLSAAPVLLQNGKMYVVGNTQKTINSVLYARTFIALATQ